ncbi:MAG: hypothetical protein ACLP29_11535 [Dissulfurispiraceae bacterium]
MFIYQNCDVTANFDYNAALGTKKSGIGALLDGSIAVKQRKFVRFRREDCCKLGRGLL